jgi:predicted DNA-binding transcriptional regulator AlpA
MSDTKESTEFLTIREAAQKSGLALKTWYDGGAGTASLLRIRFGRSVRLRRQDVENFIRERVAEAEQAAGKGVREESR